MVENSNFSRQVLVCQSRSCRKLGAAAVLAAFQASASVVTDVSIIGSACLGQCGCGPMVLIMPEQIWYSGVLACEVPAVIERHLQAGHPVRAMLYPKYHRDGEMGRLSRRGDAGTRREEESESTHYPIPNPQSPNYRYS